MTLKSDGPFETDPPVFLLKDLTTRALETHEYALAGQLLGYRPNIDYLGKTGND